MAGGTPSLCPGSSQGKHLSPPVGHLDVLITCPGVAGKAARPPASPHCSTGSLLGHFTFSPDPCNSVKRSQAILRPHCSCCLVPARKAQTEVSPHFGAGPGRKQVSGPLDGTDTAARILASTHRPVSASAVVTACLSPGLPGAAGPCSGEGGVLHGHGDGVCPQHPQAGGLPPGRG